MSPIEGVFAVVLLLLIGAVLALSIERENGHIDSEEPEPTIRRQLEACGHKLATAEQSVLIWMSVAEKQKAIIEEMARILEDDE